LRHYQESLAVNPSKSHAAHVHCGLAQTYLALGQFAEVAAACDHAEAILAEQENPFGLRQSLYGLRGVLARWANQDRQAEKMLQEAIAGLRNLHLLHEAIPLL
jgi:hypothetical protein